MPGFLLGQNMIILLACGSKLLPTWSVDTAGNRNIIHDISVMCKLAPGTNKHTITQKFGHRAGDVPRSFVSESKSDDATLSESLLLEALKIPAAAESLEAGFFSNAAAMLRAHCAILLMLRVLQKFAS